MTLRFHRPPGFDALSDSELAAQLRELVEHREQKARDAARAEGKRFLGRRRVLSQSRRAYPSSRERRFGIRPTVAARSKWARIERLQRNAAWLADYEAALESFRAPNLATIFPYGTFKLRRDYRIACRPPPA